MSDREPHGRQAWRDERGVALLITVLLLLMISAIGVAALQHAGDEQFVGSSSRRKISTVYAADAGLNLVANQLFDPLKPFPDTTPIDITQFIQNEAGLWTSVRTGTLASAVAQPVMKVGRTQQAGNQLNIGSSSSLSYGIYRAAVVATDSGGGNVELQAQFSVLEGSAAY